MSEEIEDVLAWRAAASAVMAAMEGREETDDRASGARLPPLSAVEVVDEDGESIAVDSSDVLVNGVILSSNDRGIEPASTGLVQSKPVAQ